MQNRVVLLTGGARSGKSRYAQELAQNSGKKVLFVATAQGLDVDMQKRIARHREDRPQSWKTLEAHEKIGTQIQTNIGDAQLVIIDCITMLINNVFNNYGDEIPVAEIEDAANKEICELIECFKSIPAEFILVTNEVGLGIVPATRVGRVYQDLLGKVNQRLVAASDEVLFMVSGLPLRVK